MFCANHRQIPPPAKILQGWKCLGDSIGPHVPCHHACLHWAIILYGAIGCESVYVGGCLLFSEIPIFVTIGNHDRYEIYHHFLSDCDPSDQLEDEIWDEVLDAFGIVFPGVIFNLEIEIQWPDEPTNYYKYINPEFNSGNEDSNRLADFYFNYGDFRFIWFFSIFR